MGESWIQPKMHHFNLSQWLFQSRETSHSPFSPSVSFLSPFSPLFIQESFPGWQEMAPAPNGAFATEGKLLEKPTVPQKSLGCCRLGEQEPSWAVVVHFGGPGMGRALSLQLQIPRVCPAPGPSVGGTWEDLNVELNPS